jgi:hypothetical protein
MMNCRRAVVFLTSIVTVQSIVLICVLDAEMVHVCMHSLLHVYMLHAERADCDTMN